MLRFGQIRLKGGLSIMEVWTLHLETVPSPGHQVAAPKTRATNQELGVFAPLYSLLLAQHLGHLRASEHV